VNDQVIVDATECKINRPQFSWFQRATYSGYKKTTTLKYEVAMSEKRRLSISYSGPFVGPTSDIEIFRSHLKGEMEENGWIGLADGTYQGEPAYLLVSPRPYKYLTPYQKELHRRLSKRRVLVENLIGRLKSFHCLSSRWRHSVLQHHIVFHVVLNVVCVDLSFRPLRKE